MPPVIPLLRRWGSSIRSRLVAVVVILLLLSSVGSVLLLRVVMFDRLEEEINLSLDHEAEEFQLLAGGVDPRTGEPFDDDLSAIFDVYFSREIADEGEALLSFIDGELYQTRRANDVPEPTAYEPAIEYWLSLDELEKGTISTPAGTATYTAVPASGEPFDGLFVIAHFPEGERREIDDAIQALLIVHLGTAALASLLALALAGRILRPLRSLAGTARTISETDLTRRIDTHGRGEASHIAQAFNDMLGRLQQSFTTQRQFLDDTSHELRSPLTIIRGHLELLELEETREDRAATVALVTDEVDRMNQIVSDLFLLARAERPDFLQPESVGIRELILTTHRKMTALADRNWQFQAPPETFIPADRRRLVQALLQLADNAVNFTTEGSAIQIGADIEPKNVRLWVADSGPGVPAKEAAHIFTRFNRGSNQSPSTGGAGLGLSIVAAIAEAHGGHAALVHRTGWGACFEIKLPRHPE